MRVCVCAVEKRQKGRWFWCCTREEEKGQGVLCWGLSSGWLAWRRGCGKDGRDADMEGGEEGKEVAVVMRKDGRQSWRMVQGRKE